MKRKKIYRVVSALLILTISACDLSDYVKANSSNIVETTEEVESNEFENEQISVEDSIQDVSKEDQVIDKTLNTTTFEGEDGKKELVMHGYNVRYKDDEGQLIDYDPSLVKVQNQETDAGTELEGYVYENKDGDCKHYIPETLTEDTPILMEKNDYQISFRPIFDREEIPIKVEDSTAQIIEQQKVDVDSSEKEKTSKKEKSNQKEAETVTISAESINSDELEEVEVSEEKVVNIYEDEVSIDNTASYTVEDNSTELQYISQENGIKEMSRK